MSSTQRIEKNDRVRVRPDAEQRRSELIQQALERGLSRSDAREVADQELAREQEHRMDEMGEAMGEEFVSAAVQGEDRADQRPQDPSSRLRVVGETPSVVDVEPTPTPDER